MARFLVPLLLVCAPALLWVSGSDGDSQQAPQRPSEPTVDRFRTEIPNDPAAYRISVVSLGDPQRDFPIEVEFADRRFFRGERLRISSRPPGRLSQPEIERPFVERKPSVSPDSRRMIGPPGPRRFHLHVTDGPLQDARQYETFWANPIAQGTATRVYLDALQTPTRRIQKLAAEIIRLWEGRIRRGLETHLGPVPDIDGDGVFTILLSPRLEKLQSGNVRLRGFVRASDFRKSLAAPFSNHADMMCLNSTIRCGPGLESLLAHEGAHAVCCGLRIRNRLPVEEDWLNEAIAHVMETLITHDRSNLRHRIAAFRKAPHRYPLVVADYYRSGLWRSDGCRGATFLFLKWLTDEYGTATLRKLLLGKTIGIRNIESATGEAFEDLFSKWAAQQKPRSQPPRLLRGTAQTMFVPRKRFVMIKAPRDAHIRVRVETR